MTISTSQHMPLERRFASPPYCAAMRSGEDAFRVDVVTTSHNYGCYLQECIDSLKSQDLLGKLILVDDASSDNTPEFSIQVDQYLRVDFQNVTLSRGAGLQLTDSHFVLFMDADNTLPEGYIAAAIRLFKANPKLAFVYPSANHFGDRTGLFYAAPTWDIERFERENIADTCSVFRKEALIQTDTMSRRIESIEDWYMWRRIMESGYWEAERNSVPLNYRVHSGSLLTVHSQQDYYTQANFTLDTVTLFTTYSQRVHEHPELWQCRLDWIERQLWPKSQLRLVVANTCGQPDPCLPRGLAGVSIYQQCITPGLETDEYTDTRERQVQTTVAAIYNRAWKEIDSRLILTIEDDIFPHAYDLIERMLRSFDARTCAVSAAYRLRTPPFVFCHWYGHESCPRQSTETRQGVERIGGNGFGCMMLRKELLKRPFFGNSEVSRFYDTDFWFRVWEQYQVKLDWSLACDHVDCRGNRF